MAAATNPMMGRFAISRQQARICHRAIVGTRLWIQKAVSLGSDLLTVQGRPLVEMSMLRALRPLEDA